MGYKEARLRRLNAVRTNAGGDCVLYWAQACRRLHRFVPEGMAANAAAAAAHLRLRTHKTFV